MTRKILFSLSLLAGGMCLAAPLTPEEALERLGNQGPVPGTRSAIIMRPAMTVATKIGEPALYVFDNQDAPGFKVVSADNAVTPLLGYSDYDTFDPDNMSPALQDWLYEYARQIDYVRNNSQGAVFNAETRTTLPAWPAIAPLLKTTWNQETPYNNLCPSVSGQKTPTGCVATSMSQVMNYFKYPEKGKGSISYSMNGQTLSMNFANTTFDWGNMLNSYTAGNYSTTEATAVATLMQAAGYSVQMSYSPNYSGAVSGFIPGALVNYFGYDPSVHYVSRYMKTYTEWATLIYNNLKNVGPVIYDGSTADSSGHSFVCDGYNGNGYFHFNWGWGGSGDGYFLLDSLDPSVIGVGGALGGFDFGQDIVLDIKKPVAGSTPTADSIEMTGSAKGYISSSFLYLQVYGADLTGYRYYGINPEMPLFDVGLKFTPADNDNATPIYAVCSNNSTFQKFPYQPLNPGIIMYFDGLNYPYPMFILSSLNLSDNVKYKATAAYKIVDGGDWTEVPTGVGNYNYFYITKNGTSYSIENFEQMQFTCSNMKLDTGLYYNKAVEVSMTLVNNNNTELTRSAIPVLLDSNDKIQFLGDSFVYTLSPGESATKTVVTSLYKQFNGSFTRETPYYLGLYDLDTKTIYYKSASTVSMQTDPGEAEYTCVINIDNGKLIQEATAESNALYEVENAQYIETSVDIKVESGLFTSPISVYVGNVRNDRLYVMLTYPLDLRIINAGESQKYNVTVSYPGAEVDQIYYLIADVDNDYNIMGTTDVIAFKALSNESGVESLLSPDELMTIYYDKAAGLLHIGGGKNGIKAVEAYSLNGMKLAPHVDYSGDNATMDLSSLAKGVIVVTAIDRDGNRKSMKLAL